MIQQHRSSALGLQWAFLGNKYNLLDVPVLAKGYHWKGRKSLYSLLCQRVRMSSGSSHQQVFPPGEQIHSTGLYVCSRGWEILTATCRHVWMSGWHLVMPLHGGLGYAMLTEWVWCPPCTSTHLHALLLPSHTQGCLHFWNISRLHFRSNSLCCFFFLFVCFLQLFLLANWSMRVNTAMAKESSGQAPLPLNVSTLPSE